MEKREEEKEESEEGREERIGGKEYWFMLA